MTALADIAKAAAVMYGDTLRGSDLTQFNEAHPRDEAGRFAAVAGGGGDDPRRERQGRRLRRARRGAKAAQVQVAATAAPAEADPRSLQHLARRILPRKTEDRGLKRKFAPGQPPKEVGEKTHLNDETYFIEEDGKVVGEPVFMLLEHDRAQQLVDAKSLIVGAANKMWGGPPLSVFTESALREFAETNDVSGKVVIQVGRDQALVVDNQDRQTDPGAMQLDRGQYFALDEAKGPSHVGAFKGPLQITTQGKDVELPRIHVGAYDKFTAGMFLGDDDDYPNINVAKAAIWEEDEHPRDLRSGRFAAQAGGGGGGSDPRISRNMRRRRRAGRALANVAHAPVAAPQEAPYEERGLQRKYAPVRLPELDRGLARKYASTLIPEAPEDATVTLLVDDPVYDDEPAEYPSEMLGDKPGVHVLATVEARRAHYERTNVYPEIRVALKAADGLIQEAASGEINADTREAQLARALFSKMFLQGQRRDSQFTGEITQQDVQQAVGQLQGSQRLFNLMQKHGAGQWTMTTGEYVKPETAAATTISVHADDLAALTGYAPPRTDTGFGAKIMPISQYRGMQAVAADREAAIALARDIVSMRVEDAEGYKRLVVPSLLRFSGGEVSFDEAMADTARSLGNEAAARHYDRQEQQNEQALLASAEVRTAAAKRTAERRAVTTAQQAAQEQARAELASDPRVRSADLGYEMDDLRDWDLANPDFTGMTVQQVPAKLRPAFARWERAQARKQSS